MAIPTNIKTLLTGNVVEWAGIEFKETWNAEASLKTVCAFANDLDQKQWQKITKSAFIISERCPILLDHRMMRKKICSIWQTEFRLMTG